MTFDEILEVRFHLKKSLDLLDEKILEYDWRHLVNRGLHVLAIRAYREQNKNCSLKEAKEACDAFRDMLNT